PKAQVVVRVEVPGGHLQADARLPEAELVGEAAEGGDRILGLVAAPAAQAVDERVLLELVAIGLAGEEDDRPLLGRDREALEGGVALGVLADEPAQRHRMDDEEPVEPGGADRASDAGAALGELGGGEVVLGHGEPRQLARSGGASAAPWRRTSLSTSAQTSLFKAAYSGESCTVT